MTGSILICLAVWSAADYESKNPLSDMDRAEIPAPLVGIWRAESKQQVSYFFVDRIRFKPVELLACSGTTIDLKDGAPDRFMERAVCFPTVVDKDTVYLNVVESHRTARGLESAGSTRGVRRLVRSYTFMKCHIKDGELTVRELDSLFVRNAIILKRLQGKERLITAPSAELLKFLIANDDAAFPPPAKSPAYTRFTPPK